MKHLAIALIALTLCSCGDSKEVKQAKWLAFCTRDNAFTPAQCQVLYAIKGSSDDAQNEASWAAAFSGVALGFSAGRK